MKEEIRDIVHTEGIREENNSAGNHIVGVKCRKEFGYFGGKKNEEGNKEKPGGFTNHCINWEKNPNRCPQYLYRIHEVDDRWPKTDEEGQERLHKIIIFTELREYAKKIGTTLFNTLLKRFSCIKEEGYDLSELFTMDLTLIKRKTA